MYLKYFPFLQIRRVISSTAHTHEGNESAIQAAKIRQTMKDHVTVNRGRPGQILADTLQTCTVEVRAAVGNMDSVKRSIRRQKKGSMPKEPASLRDLVLPEEWTTTGNPYNHPFLFYDSGPESANLILLFGTEQGLRHMCRSDTWFMDGTHSTAPGIFNQIYIIRAPLGESAVTCVYALLPGKSQEVYETMFSAIQDKCEELGFGADPLHIVTDFEQAVIRAVRATFGEHVSHRGCFYHLSQSTWRKIQELGMVDLYRNSDDVKLFCGMIDGLAFLPVGNVSDGMDYLRNNTSEGCERLLDYFDKTYVSGTFRRIQPVDEGVLAVRVRRIPPLFNPALWNVHQTTLGGDARTNNLCETWNNSFQRLIGYNHPSVWTIIDAFRKDHAMVEMQLFQDANSQPPRKRVKAVTRNLQERLRNLCSDFVDDRKNLEEFLHGVGHCIRWK